MLTFLLVAFLVALLADAASVDSPHTLTRKYFYNFPDSSVSWQVIAQGNVAFYNGYNYIKWRYIPVPHLRGTAETYPQNDWPRYWDSDTGVDEDAATWFKNDVVHNTSGSRVRWVWGRGFEFAFKWYKNQTQIKLWRSSDGDIEYHSTDGLKPEELWVYDPVTGDGSWRWVLPFAWTVKGLGGYPYFVESNSTAVADYSREYHWLSPSYNATAAKEYADYWWNRRNGAYKDMSSEGGDCANFVSQSLRAGGYRFQWGSTRPWYHILPDYYYEYTSQWVRAYELRSFLLGDGNTGTYYDHYPPNDINASVGDVVIYDLDHDGVYDDHSAIVVSTYGTDYYNSSYKGDLVDYHTTDTYHRIWNLLSAVGDPRLVHYHLIRISG